jgi:hypothetical protein
MQLFIREREPLKTKHARPPLSWWVEKLGISDSPSKRELFAQCPAHADNGPSLHITKKPDGDAVVHCFAGCSYEAIIKALEEGKAKRPNTEASKKDAKKPGTDLPALVWWERYTGIPLSTWERLGIEDGGDYVAFTFGDNCPYAKGRLKGTKTFKWSPAGGSPPFLWPAPTKSNIQSHIFLCEGESDTGVLRHLGFSAFGFTKGAVSKLPRNYVSGFELLGVEKVTCAFDLDDSGDEGFAKVKEFFAGSKIHVDRLDLGKLTEPFSTEKDLKDLYSRLGDELKTHLEAILQEEDTKTEAAFLSLEERSKHNTKVEWLWEGMIPLNSVSLLRGPPKIGKSTFLFSLFNRMRVGGSLGGRNVTPGGVVYVTEEGEITLNSKHEVHGPLPHVFSTTAAEAMGWDWDELIKQAVGVARRKEAKLLVIDTLAAFAGFQPGEENDASSVLARMEPLSRLRGELTVLLIHHEAKSGGTRGSSAIDGAVDAILAMRGGSGIHRTIESINRIESNTQLLSIDPKTGKETILLVKPKTPRGEQRLTDLILGFLESNPNSSEKVIAQACKVPRVYNQLVKLVKQGLIHKETLVSESGVKTFAFSLANRES